jgi:hypothetical protein
MYKSIAKDLKFKPKARENIQDSATRLYKTIVALTSDAVTEITCDQLHHTLDIIDRAQYMFPMVITYGQDVTDQSIYDRFSYKDRAYWFYNNDVSCGNGLQLYVHPDVAPVQITGDIDLFICE